MRTFPGPLRPLLFLLLCSFLYPAYWPEIPSLRRPMPIGTIAAGLLGKRNLREPSLPKVNLPDLWALQDSHKQRGWSWFVLCSSRKFPEQSYSKSQPTNDFRDGVVPCPKIPLRKILAPAQRDRATNTRFTSRPTQSCQASGPGSVINRMVIKNG